MGILAENLRALVSRATHDAAGLHVCRGRLGRGRCDRGLHQRRPDHEYDLVVLEDSRHAIPPYDAVLLLSPKRARDQALQVALKPLLGRIDIADMREANLRANGNDAAASPEAVARWLWEKVGGR